jgi:hypothetical protein
MIRRNWFAGLALLAVGFGGAVAARAQGGDPGQDGGPPMAMGAGRMVRGTVTAVAGDKVTLKTDSGDLYTVSLTPNTRVIKGREQGKASDVKVGDGIGAMGEIDQPTKTVHALFVSVMDAGDMQKLKDTLGKTWIAGKVTAIDDVKLTILRSDKVTQVIQVDEDTSFKRGMRGVGAGAGMGMGMGGGGYRGGAGRSGGAAAPPAENTGGESITLADVKVGDEVAGQGSLKNGGFVPTLLGVVDPSQRRRRPGADGAAPAAAGSGPAAPPPPASSTTSAAGPK